MSDPPFHGERSRMRYVRHLINIPFVLRPVAPSYSRSRAQWRLAGLPLKRTPFWADDRRQSELTFGVRLPCQSSPS